MKVIEVNATTWGDTVLFLITMVANIAVIILCIYGIVLVIGLLKKGNKALDIYIQKNKDKEEKE